MTIFKIAILKIVRSFSIFLENGTMTEWTSWGSCSLLCGEGKKYRTKVCNAAKFAGTYLTDLRLDFEQKNGNS